jgi:ankyrin repeat protein
MPAAFPGDSESAGPTGRELSPQELRRLVELEYKEARGREGRGGSLLLWEDAVSEEQQDLLRMEYERAVREERALVDEFDSYVNDQPGTALPALADVVTHSNVRLSFEDGEPGSDGHCATVSNGLATAGRGAPDPSAMPHRGAEGGSRGVRLGFTPEVSNLTSATTVASAFVDDLENSVSVSSGSHDDASRSVARERLGRLQSRLSPLIDSLSALSRATDGPNGSRSAAPKIPMPEDARGTVEALLVHTRVIYATLALRHRSLAAGSSLLGGSLLPLRASEAERRSIRLELVESELQLADHIALKLEAALQTVGGAEGRSRARLQPTCASRLRVEGSPNAVDTNGSDGGVNHGSGGGVNGCGSGVNGCGSASPPASAAQAVSGRHAAGASAAEKALVEVRRRRGLELYQAVRSRDGSSVYTLMLEPDLVNVNVCDEQHNTPLHLAVALGDVASVRAILAHPEIDANRRTRRKGWTPLHLLSARRVEGGEETARQHQLARVLLQSGKADVGARTVTGETPVQLAGQKGNAEMVRILEGALRRQATGSASGESSPQDGGSPPHEHEWLRREEARFQEQWASQASVCQTPEGGVPGSRLSI